MCRLLRSNFLRGVKPIKSRKYGLYGFIIALYSSYLRLFGAISTKPFTTRHLTIYISILYKRKNRLNVKTVLLKNTKKNVSLYLCLSDVYIIPGKWFRRYHGRKSLHIYETIYLVFTNQLIFNVLCFLLSSIKICHN